MQDIISQDQDEEYGMRLLVASLRSPQEIADLAADVSAPGDPLACALVLRMSLARGRGAGSLEPAGSSGSQGLVHWGARFGRQGRPMAGMQAHM